MEQREKFIVEMLKAEKPFCHLCKDFGISEKTGHKWKNRYHEQGKHGLYDRSRVPGSSPNSMSEDMVLAILKLKEAHPYWGGKKIHVLLQKLCKEQTPSLSSINRILQKAGKVKKRRIIHAPAATSRLRQHIQAEAANDVWAIDFKGWWKSDGEVCEPFTVRDVHTRMILEARLMRSKSSESVRAVMTELFRNYGLPKVIRSDNGPPFSAPNGLLNLTNLACWWITLGILPDRTDPGKPGQNGSLERMHGDIAREVEGRIAGGFEANQRYLDAWREEYNTIRPNEALGMATPAEVYHPSDRAYSGDYDDLEYPPGFLPRKVYGSGEISIHSIRIMIGFALRGLTVGLRATEDNRYDVFLADFLLGSIDIDSCCFVPLEHLQ